MVHTLELSSVPKRREWRSLTLRPWVLIILVLVEAGLLMGVIALYVLSQRRSGFVKIGTQPSTASASSIMGTPDRPSPLLWTSLPILVFTVFRIFRSSVITSFIVEIPYMELYKSCRDGPTKVKKSVYLDYRTLLAPKACWQAFKHGHTLLGISMILSFLASIIAVPLAGRLFAEGEERLPVATVMDLQTEYNAPVNMTGVDYAAIMDAVTASWIHDAPYPGGTDGTFAVPRVVPRGSQQNYTITIDTNCPRLTLDCEVIDSVSFSTTPETSELLRIEFSAEDRGCSISEDMVSSSRSAALGAYSQRSCDEAAGTTRVLFFYGAPSPSNLQLENPVLVSCIPSYWNVTGSLDVTSNLGSSSTRVEAPVFSPKSSKRTNIDQFARTSFEDGVMSVGAGNSAVAVQGQNRMAELVIRYVQTQGQEIDGATIAAAVTRLYPAIYVVLNALYFYNDPVAPLQISGILRVPENRLHTVGYAAIPICILLGILIIETVSLIWYLHKHSNGLAEEPRGLVGAANILHNSNISTIVSTFNNEAGFDGRLRRTVRIEDKRKVKSDDELLEKDCYWLHSDRCPCAQLVVDMDDGRPFSHQPRCVHNNPTGTAQVVENSQLHQRPVGLINRKPVANQMVRNVSE